MTRRNFIWGLVIVLGNAGILYSSLAMQATIPWRLGHLALMVGLFNLSLIFWQRHWQTFWHGTIDRFAELVWLVLGDLAYGFLAISPAVHGWQASVWQVANVANYLAIALIIVAAYEVGQAWYQRRVPKKLETLWRKVFRILVFSAAFLGASWLARLVWPQAGQLNWQLAVWVIGCFVVGSFWPDKRHKNSSNT